jgi:hypothetical protein
MVFVSRAMWSPASGTRPHEPGCPPGVGKPDTHDGYGRHRIGDVWQAQRSAASLASCLTRTCDPIDQRECRDDDAEGDDDADEAPSGRMYISGQYSEPSVRSPCMRSESCAAMWHPVSTASGVPQGEPAADAWLAFLNGNLSASARTTYSSRNSISWAGSPSPNTWAQPPRVSMYSRIRHTLPSRTSNTKQ